MVTTGLLCIIAVSLVAIAVRPNLEVRPVQAQSATEYSLFIEPGTQLLRSPDGSQQVYGRVVIDLRTGTVWGFPSAPIARRSVFPEVVEQISGYRSTSITRTFPLG